MDIEKIKTRAELNRLVWNCHLQGRIAENTATRIMDYIDSTIGGGEIAREAGGRVIVFPKQNKTYFSPWTAPERVDGNLERIIRAKDLPLSFITKLPEIDIRSLEDCKGLTVERIEKIRGINEKTAARLHKILTAAYDGESWAREMREAKKEN